MILRICITAFCIFLFVGKGAARELRAANFTIGESKNLPLIGEAKSKNFEHFLFKKPETNSELKSKSFIIKSGAGPKDGFSPRSQNWRWYDDEEKRTPGIALAEENIAPTDIPDGNIIKLRMTLKETAGVAGKDIKFKLQFSTFSDFSEDVQELAEIIDCNRDSLWCYADGAGNDNEVIKKKLLSDSDRCVHASGKGCGTYNEAGNSVSTFKHKKNSAVEYEFTIKASGALPNKIYFFRAYDVKNNLAVPSALGSRFPSIASGGARFIFEIQGLGEGTPTEGVLTDVETFFNGVNFGLIPFNREIEAAQRLIVSTNARHGYKIYVYERQGLLGEDADIIGASGTNGEPLPWSMPEGSKGVYGYHAGDDSLSNGSIRFAPDNTYAKFADQPGEVAFHSRPIHGDMTDIIFKIQVGAEQEAGNYESSIVYVAIPNF